MSVSSGGVAGLIFDVDGTLAETEELHRLAFNSAFAAAGLPHNWDRERYRQLLGTTGGRQRLLRFFREAGLPEDEALAMRLHRDKNRLYAQAMEHGHLELRRGVASLVARAASAGLKLAIATTTSRANLVALLRAFADQLPAAGFEAIVVGEDVARLKPDPEAYLLALDRLGMAADRCLAFEDSENGLAAAVAAGLRTVVTPGLYTSHQDFAAAWAVLPDLAGFNWDAAT